VANEERERQDETARKLSTGRGCFAMLSVMFAVGLLGTGVGMILDADGQKVFGSSAVAAGLAGIAAFVFFGYYASSTSSTTRGKEQRRAG
jgi:hypothetical protein